MNRARLAAKDYASQAVDAVADVKNKIIGKTPSVSDPEDITEKPRRPDGPPPTSPRQAGAAVDVPDVPQDAQPVAQGKAAPASPQLGEQVSPKPSQGRWNAAAADASRGERPQKSSNLLGQNRAPSQAVPAAPAPAAASQVPVSPPASPQPVAPRNQSVYQQMPPAQQQQPQQPQPQQQPQQQPQPQQAFGRTAPGSQANPPAHGGPVMGQDRIDYANRTAPLPPPPNYAPPPPPGQIPGASSPGAHMMVQMGSDEQHTLPKGVGFQTGGTVESVDHKGGQTTVHYKAGSHEQVLKVDENSGPGSAPGQHSALSDAVDHLKPGDKFDMKISRDTENHELAQVNDKTDNFKAVVHDNGVVEKGAAQNSPTLERGRAATR